MNQNALLENYSRGLASTGKTRTQYMKFARDFLEYSEGDFSREKINGYLEHLRKQHSYQDGSVNLVFRVIRTIFSRNESILKAEGYEWPYRRGESPNIREDRIQAPALHPQTIGRAITAVKSDGSPEERAFLALSTTYGLRRIEMVEMGTSDIRLKDKTIHVATAKHGRERTHLIPDVIIPYLSEYDFSQERSDYFLFALWYQIENRISFPHTHKVGWHSVRRSLNTLLLREFSEIDVMSFLRWKHRTSSHMPFRYSAIKWVGDEDEIIEVAPEYSELDIRIFSKHPFLHYWSDV